MARGEDSAEERALWRGRRRKAAPKEGRRRMNSEKTLGEEGAEGARGGMEWRVVARTVDE